MLLAIDAGNTQTVLGLYPVDGADDDVEPVEHWRISSNAERTADEYAQLIGQLLGLRDKSLAKEVTGIAIASSVPSITTAIRDLSARYFASEPIVVGGGGVKTGMPVLYDNPRDVGPDRIADAIAAFDLFGGPTIVVDFGTGTTFEAVSEKGEYLGGAIVPGIEISMDALYARAAILRRVELVPPKNVIGKSTVESITSGAVYGYASLCDGMCDRVEAEVGAPCNVVATGGLSHLIAPVSRRIEHHEPWLTLHGVRLVYHRNVDA